MFNQALFNTQSSFVLRLNLISTLDTWAPKECFGWSLIQTIFSSALAERSSGMQGQEGYEPFNTTLLPCFLLQWWKRPKESSCWDKACTVWTTGRGRIRMEFREIIQSLDRQGVCPEVKSVCVYTYTGFLLDKYRDVCGLTHLFMNAFAVVINLRITDLSGAHLVKQTSDMRSRDTQNNR